MKKLMSYLAILSGILVILPSTASAVPCSTGTLADYIALGSSGCDVDSVLFSDFTPLDVPAAAIQISPDDVTVNPLNALYGPGLEFVVDQIAGAGEFFDIRIGYLVSNGLFNGITLSMTGSSAVDDAAVTTIEDIWLGAPFDPFGFGDSTLIVFEIEGDSDTFEQDIFSPVTSIGVIKDIGVDGGLFGQGSLYSASNQFSVEVQAAPEPSTSLLVSIGFGCAALLYWSLGFRNRRNAG
jgi:hypothetical protein